ncbi:hypothetical protein [Acinetobacter rudis]|uniref:Lipoprotein n=1 Tax=Acinetobacter rudis TaxID=632955 RepID=A0AAW8J9T2_9GAMM|nr:hypothetical protein [Acinetobacter rudis]MDQ8936837.1 hypothetical protein [Acinetobacter rudis]MDQ8954077.1 hypothetical protein [Acinetobacter rudis]MDQ9019057.1 hypothetical protein [Acinetobacter rudis]
MKFKVIVAALILAPLALTACSKKEKAAEDQSASAVVTPTDSEKVTPEQQAAIDSIDKPIADEKNTDVPAEVAAKPADAATPETDAK